MNRFSVLIRVIERFGESVKHRVRDVDREEVGKRHGSKNPQTVFASIRPLQANRYKQRFPTVISKTEKLFFSADVFFF